MYTLQASEPDSRPPTVSFLPPKAPPISAPEVPMFTLLIEMSFMQRQKLMPKIHFSIKFVYTCMNLVLRSTTNAN